MRELFRNFSFGATTYKDSVSAARESKVVNPRLVGEKTRGLPIK